MLQDFEQQTFFQSRLLTQDDRFRQSLHAQAKQSVDHELHGRPHAARSHIEDVLAEDLENRSALLIGLLIAADKDDQAALIHLRHASRNGSIDHRRTFLACRVVQTA